MEEPQIDMCLEAEAENESTEEIVTAETML